MAPLSVMLPSALALIIAPLMVTPEVSILMLLDPTDRLMRLSGADRAGPGRHGDRVVAGRDGQAVVALRDGGRVVALRDRQRVVALRPSLFGPIVEQLGAAKLLRDGAVAVEKPFGRDLASPVSWTPGCIGCCARARSCASITSSARSRSSSWSTCRSSPTSRWPSCGTARACPACRSRWPKISASRAAAGSATPSARSATWSRAPCCRCWPWSPWTRRQALAPATRQDKKAEVFRAMPPGRPPALRARPVPGYADIPGVASGSATETFVALRLEIDNWRWADVPIFLRAVTTSMTPCTVWLPSTQRPTRVSKPKLLLRNESKTDFSRVRRWLMGACSDIAIGRSTR